MKILLVSVKSQVSHGGIAAWTKHFLHRCDQLNIPCLLVNTELLGKRAVQHRAKHNLFDELARTRRIFSQLKAGLREKPDVAHLNTSCAFFGLLRDCMVAARIKRAGVKLVTHYHCDIPYWVRNGVSRFFLGKLVRCSDRNLVLCSSSKAYLKEQFGADSLLVPNFIEDSTLRRDEKSIQAELRQILYVGRMETEKGALELYHVAERFPEMEFAVIGEISPEVQKWQVPENVRHLGTMPHEQVLAHMDAADLFLFPSHTEGCSMALMEALARGLPAVATDAGANGDLLGPEGGILVPVGDVQAMAEALERLRDPALRKKMSRSAVEQIRRGYTQAQLDSLLAQLINT